MTATHTIPERLVMLVCALLSLAVAVFVTARVFPVRHLLTRTEAQSAIGLLLSAALLTLGVTLIVDWRRKRRARAPFELFASLISDARAVSLDELSEADILRISSTKSSSDYHVDDINEDGSLKPRALMYPDSNLKQPVRAYADTFSAVPVIKKMMQGRADPQAELQRHLTAALAVLLREPALTIDASTMRMLAKHKERRAVVRDEKGRWRRVQ
ncbi:hypothetical protein [Bradyrhizobium lupini]|uniref:hypothetical protein n=1 Tax=Rhizobium lupini TaxID=136996 RepID=UPI0034C60F63